MSNANGPYYTNGSGLWVQTVLILVWGVCMGGVGFIIFGPGDPAWLLAIGVAALVAGTLIELDEKRRKGR